MVKTLGWILIAYGIATGISRLADSLPTQDAAQLIHLFFNPPATAPGIVDHLSEAAFSSEFISAVLIGFLGAVLRGVAVWAQQVLSTRAALGEKEMLRGQLVEHRMNAAGAHADRAGEDAILASKGLDGLDKYYTEFLPALVSAMVVPLGLGAWILFNDWVSALILVLTIPLIPFFMILIGRFTEARVDDARDGLNKLSHHLLELARGLPVLVGLRRAGFQRKALATVSGQYQQTTMGTLRAAFMSGLALELISTLSVAVIAVFIGVRLVYGGLDLYTGLTVLVLAAEVYLPFRDIGSAYHASEDGLDALQRAREQVNQPVPNRMADLLEGSAEASTTSTATDRVQLTNVSIAYKAFHEIKEEKLPDITTLHKDDPRRAEVLEAAKKPRRRKYDVEILDPVVSEQNLELQPNTLTVMGSASGTGKTTLLAAIAGLLRDGEAEFSGHVSGLERREIVWLSQHPNFSETTVAEELILYLRATQDPTGGSLFSNGATSRTITDADAQLIATALEAAGLADYQPRDVNELSPGERRRLGFARVLTRLMAGAARADTGRTEQSWLIVLDEPTAHLDAASADRVREVIANLKRGKLPNGWILPTMMLVASHDEHLHAMADQFVGDDVVSLTQHSEQAADASVTAPDTSRAATSTAEQDDTTRDGDPVAAYAQKQEESRIGVSDWFRFLPFKERKFLAGIFWAVAAVLSGALLSALSGWLIVQASYQPPILYLLSIIVAVRFFGIGRAVFRYAERLLVHDAVLGWANRVRLRIWDALSSESTQWSRLTRTGGALQLLISDVDELRDAVPRVIVPIPAAIIAWLATLGIVAFMAPGAWWPAVVAGILGIVVIPLIVAIIDARTTALLTDHRTGLVRDTSGLFTSAADLAGNRLATALSTRFKRQDLSNARPLKRNAMAAGIGQGLISLVTAWAAIQIMFECIQNGISAPNTALVTMLLLALAEPFGLMATGIQESTILRHQLGKVLPLLKQRPGHPEDWVSLEPADSTQTQQASDAVRVEGVSVRDVDVSYQAGAAPLVLEDFSLEAHRSDFVVVTGPSGSGKSTLLAVVLGFLEPVDGSFVVYSTTDDVHASLGTIAWCPQEAYLFDSTLRSNLLLARDPDDRPSDEELIEILHTVGLGDWYENSPAGLDTRLGPSGHFISGGQRQRVAVARALVARADVLLLDEPTAHLGADEAAVLVDDLRAALSDKTVIMVTHDQRFAETSSVETARNTTVISLV